MKRKKKLIQTNHPSYRTVKTSLKSILRNYQDIQPEINKLVIRCNDIVIQTYQFIRLYVLHKYHNKQELPIINKKFIEYCFKVQGTRDNRGKK